MRLVPFLLLVVGCSEYGLNDDKDAFPDTPDDTGQDDTDDTGDTDDGDPTTTPSGRVLTILLTLSDDWMDQDVARTLLLNSVEWASPSAVTSPSVLVIRDDDHGGEDTEDSENVWQWLLDAGYDADFVDEPSSGISDADLSGYDVAILSNPGHSPDDVATVEALYDFSCAGQGIIFQGDDMAHFADEGAFSMESLTRLVYQDNGTSYHGYDVDNDEGSAYEVRLVSTSSRIVSGISGETFRYCNDIDTTEIASSDVEVLAWTTVEGTSLPLKPVIAAWSQ